MPTFDVKQTWVEVESFYCCAVAEGVKQNTLLGSSWRPIDGSAMGIRQVVKKADDNGDYYVIRLHHGRGGVHWIFWKGGDSNQMAGLEGWVKLESSMLRP
uniref:PUD1_2 domain-containing protein n=1 Tax=Steinernema glaseri TaxID=37863 RepID=A0A1I7YHU4_9BILA